MYRVLMCVAVLVITACSNYAVPKYGIAVENVTALRKSGARGVGIGRFTATSETTASIGCRLVGTLDTPDGRPYVDYVRQALIDELRVSEVFAEPGNVTLTGNLDLLEFSSTEGTWTLALTVKSSNGHALTVSHVYHYDTAFIAEKACALTAQAFEPAVQSLIAALVAHRDFGALVGAAPAEPAASQLPSS